MTRQLDIARFVLDDVSQEARLKMAKLISELGLGFHQAPGYMPLEQAVAYATRDVEWFDYKTNTYVYKPNNAGRLAITIYMQPYVGCCGLYILAAPHYSWEQPLGQFTNGYNPEECIAGQYHYSTVEALEAGIKSKLSSHLGDGPSYIITDYSDGHGVLFQFCKRFIDRSKFAIDSLGRFVNGNTGYYLGTWMFKNKGVRRRVNKEQVFGNNALASPALNALFDDPVRSTAVAVKLSGLEE